MEVVIFSCILLLISTACADESRYQRENQSQDRGDTDDAIAYESFNSPIYGGPKGVAAPVKGYPLPASPALPAGYAVPSPPALPAGYAVPSAPALPAGYAVPSAPALPTSPVLPAGYTLPAPYTTYLNAASPYAYGSASPYAYGSASPYAYGNAYNRYSVMPFSAPYYGNGAPYSSPYAGYGYPAGPGYRNLQRRSSAAYNAYPGYAGLGYRFGGLGYNAGALKGPVSGMPAPVAYAAPVPVKGNSLQYGYAPPAAQKLPVY